MPACWAPIPSNVAEAIAARRNGQVPYCTYASSLGASAPSCPTKSATPAAAFVTAAPRFTG